MALFVTVRERRLWLWALAATVAIYSTLGLTGTLARRTSEGGDPLDVFLFFFVMGFLAMTVLAYGLQIRPRGVEIGVLLGIAMVYFMMFARMTLAERTHLIEYSVLATFVREALHEGRSWGRRIPSPGLLAIAVTTLVGTVDEFLQVFLPSRVFDPIDILFNFLAAVVTVVALAVLTWIRRRSRLGRAGRGPNLA
ncbi:MAG: VanZ family protein [bacterium]|nr:VanZ family protein [bacterium]MDE0600243.1 VanZ family protein [bacterium]